MQERWHGQVQKDKEPACPLTCGAGYWVDVTGMITETTFLLNGEVCRVSDISPTTTLLQYLRQDRLLTGSKEGCGEGDCGACTVVVGENRESGMQYMALNACIQFVPMLEGKSVWTVEGLKKPDGNLHPVQEALVTSHGSQCGFCTPGFVMSVYAAFLNGDALEHNKANDLLAGNLCRCTGYRSICNAVEALKNIFLTQEDEDRIKTDSRLLRQIETNDTVSVTSDKGVFYSPTSTNALAELYHDHPQATLLAGATDVGLWVTKQHRTLPEIIHLGRIRELDTIDENEKRVLIGASVTHARAMPVLARIFPDFGELLRRLGAQQVRNSATIVGNIANGSPIGDTPPALIVLGATLNLRKGQERRQIPIEDFFIDYGKQDIEAGEFIESVEIPLSGHNTAARFYKVSKRFDQDISAVCGCFNLSIIDGEVKSARIAYGGMAATPRRAHATETALEGQPWNEETVSSVLNFLEEDFTPISDMRASAAYRMLVAKNLLRRHFLETNLPLEQTRLVGTGAAFS